MPSRRDTRHASSACAASACRGTRPKSGWMPSRSMSVPLGVTYLPTVSTCAYKQRGRRHITVTHGAGARTSPLESDSSYTLCISPLPKVRLPTSTALQLSCSAPAKISLALAVDSLTSTVRGAARGWWASCVADVTRWYVLALAPSCCTMIASPGKTVPDING